MTHRLDPIAERVEQERAVVVRMVLGADARWPIVFPAVRHTARMELANLGSAARLETPVTRRVEIRLDGLIDGEAGMEILFGIAPHAIAKRVGAVVDFGNSEGIHYHIVERAGGGDIRNRDGGMIEQVHSVEKFIVSARGGFEDNRLPD